MKITRIGMPVLALGLAGSFLTFTPEADGFSTLGFELGINQRDFRVFNNFTDVAANNNQTPEADYPGALGATLAIWKGSVEWNSTSHGSGAGDPTQPNIGDGDGDFDTHFQGEIATVGGINDNIHSEISGGSGGVLAFTESPSANGWRIRYYSEWVWADGPGNIGFQQFDLQGVACHEVGHALGLGHSTVSSATMAPSIGPGQESARSIVSDDSAGVQAVYGSADASKPVITSVSYGSGTITINGTGFSGTGNRVWFTQAGGDGSGARVFDVPSTGGGTSMTVAIPAEATVGTVIARNANSGGASFSNSWPFDPPACPSPVDYCQSGANSVSTSGATIQVSTSQSVAANDTTLVAFNLPQNQNGIFYYGPNQTQLAFGEGFRCVGGTTYRLPIVQSDLFGFVQYTVDMNNLPAGGDILPGSTWNFQFWYRDPAGGGSGFNLTGGVQVPFCN